MEGNATGSWLSVVLALAPIAIKGVDLLIIIIYYLLFVL
jgi:hypothetical protein